MYKGPITIIGMGQVGRTLLHALYKQNYEVSSVYNRTKIETSFQQKFENVKFYTGLPEEADPLGEFILITVSDDAISYVADHLSVKEAYSGIKYAAHCSGSLTSSALDPLNARGIKTASFHPIKSITGSDTSFKDVWFDIEGEEKLLEILEDIIRSFSAYSFRINKQAKPILHASAVVASNYLVVLAHIFSEISSLGGIDKNTAIKALMPLMKNTLANIEKVGVEQSLTGPIARGDVETIKLHIHKLSGSPENLELYKVLGLKAVEIAAKCKEENEALEEIRKLLL